MRLEELTSTLLLKVLEIYDRFAYPNRERRAHAAELPDGAPPQEILAHFTPLETGPGQLGQRSYFKRLGNEHYPFMKLLFQEHLFPGEYCFVVDTHDDQDITSDLPDFEAWTHLKKTNRRIKREIEVAWDEAGIPTQKLLRDIAMNRVQAVGGDDETGRILVADDEEEVAEATGKLLRDKGYEARVVYDGLRALEEVRREPPEVLVLDNEMPYCSGIQVIEKLHEEGLRRFPILLVTGGPITFSERSKATSFLCKPFSENLFLSVVRHLLSESRSGPAALQPPEEAP